MRSTSLRAAHQQKLERGPSIWLFLMTGIFAAWAALAQQPQTVPVICWLPAAAQNTVIKACEHWCKELAPVQFDMWSMMGDETALAEKISVLRNSKPPVVVVFGDYISRHIAEQCPDINQICLFSSMETKCDRVTYISCEADASLVWSTARTLHPELHRFGILFTEGCASSAEMAEQLEQTAGKGECVIRSTVQRGMCRTDSDFQKAVESLAQNGGCDLLYVPDDPNTSRFASTICAQARQADIPVLGNEAVVGKGCVAAIVRDLDELGKLMAKAVSDRLSEQKTPQRLTAPVKIKVDESVLKTFPRLQATSK